MGFRIERWFEGRTVVVIGSGPSLSTADLRKVGAARIAGRCRVIAINDAVYVAWFADWLHACDAKWWRWHPGIEERFPGIKTSLQAVPGVSLITETGISGFDPDPSKIRTGKNGGYQAIHLAAHAGAKKIVLLGIDMQGPHFFGDHPDRIQAQWGALMIPHFETIKPALAERGIHVVNASPGSALKAFPAGSLSDHLGGP